MDDNMSSIFIFYLIFNILFSAFSYAWTVFPEYEQSQDFDIVISQEKLLEYGVTFTNATSLNVTFGADYQYFTYNDRELRVKWVDSATDYIIFQKRTWIGQRLDSWFFNMDLDIQLVDHGLVTQALYNGTIIAYWDAVEGWLRINIDYGVVGFFTTIPGDAGNVTKAVIETGILTLTVGETETDAYSFREFIDWYWSMIFGYDYSAMPQSLQWLMRAMLSLNIIVGIFAIRDLTKL